jgi:hypothetical protein
MKKTKMKASKKTPSKPAKKANPMKRTAYAYQVAEENADGYIETFHKTRDDAADYVEYAVYKRNGICERDNYNDDIYFGEDSCGRTIKFYISKVPLKKNKIWVCPE